MAVTGSMAAGLAGSLLGRLCVAAGRELVSSLCSVTWTDVSVDKNRVTVAFLFFVGFGG